jgi:hypothetical protein
LSLAARFIHGRNQHIHSRPLLAKTQPVEAMATMTGSTHSRWHDPICDNNADGDGDDDDAMMMTMMTLVNGVNVDVPTTCDCDALDVLSLAVLAAVS